MQTFIEEWVKFKKILLMKEDRERSLLNKCQVRTLYNKNLEANLEDIDKASNEKISMRKDDCYGYCCKN